MSQDREVGRTACTLPKLVNLIAHSAGSRVERAYLADCEDSL